jgi:hypothetical protein
MYILQGKTRSTCHTFSTLDPRRVPNHISHVVHVGNHSLVPTRMKHAPTPEKSLGDQRQTGPTITLGHLILPPSWQPWSRGERFRPSGYTATSAYWTHITTCDQFDQYLLAGGNPSVFNGHRRGQQPWRCWPFTYHSRPSQPAVSTFHLRAPPGLQLNHIPPINLRLIFKNLWSSRGLSTTQTSAVAYIYA